MVSRPQGLAYFGVRRFSAAFPLGNPVPRSDPYVLDDDEFVPYLNDYGLPVFLDPASGAPHHVRFTDGGRMLFSDTNPNSPAQSAFGNPFLFNGRMWDPELGQYDYRTRLLDPLTGRFTTLDSIGIWGDAGNLGNGYAYTGNNPWNKTDPYGMDMLDWIVTGQWDPDAETWQQAYSGFGVGAEQGGYVALDTVSSGTPWRDAGYYSNSDPGIAAAQYAAGIGVGSGGAAIGTFLNAPTIGGLALTGVTKNAFTVALHTDAFAFGAAELGMGIGAAKGAAEVAKRGAGAQAQGGRVCIKTGYRYVAESEIKAIKDTGMLRGGAPGATYYTKDVYKSGSHAQERLSLKVAPTHRIEFEIKNNPVLILNGEKVLSQFSMPGGGAEFMTLDQVSVRILNIQPLR